MDCVKSGILALLLAVGGLAPCVRADNAENAKVVEAKQDVTRLWNIESMMWQAAENVSRRYNLNQAQRQQTHAILTEEVGRFLESHDDIWPLVRDLARYQIEGKAPDGAVAKRIGDTALSMLSEVHDAILRGNERWREILTDEQKKMHDWDLRDIERTFAKMETNFTAMTQGASVNQGVFPEPNTEEAQPVRPPRPAATFKPTLPKPFANTSPQEDWWDRYVQEFIRRYQLDDAQSEAALSILRECKERARAHRKSRERDFAQAAQRLREAHSPGQAPEVQKAKIRIWDQIMKSLNRPILDLFQELKDRLDRIPTDAQRERVGPKVSRIATREGPASATTRPAEKKVEQPEAPYGQPTVEPEQNAGTKTSTQQGDDPDDG